MRLFAIMDEFDRMNEEKLRLERQEKLGRAAIIVLGRHMYALFPTV